MYDSRIRTIHELEIKPQPVERRDPVQSYAIKKGQAYVISTVSKVRHGTFMCEGWFQADSSMAMRAMMKHVDSNETLMLSNWQLVELENAGRIRSLVGSETDARNLPGSAFLVSKEKLDKAGLKKAYVDTARQWMSDLGKTSLSDRERRDVIKEVAEKTGDPKPPSMATLYNYLNRDKTGGRFDPLMNFLRKPGSGNWRKTISSEVRKAIEHAIHLTLYADGGIDMMKTLVLRLVKEDGDFAHMREYVVAEDGDLKISESTIYRQAKAMGKYVTDALRHGRDYAERANAPALLQSRPTAPMMIVDVDHTTLNIVVFDPELPVAYGRPDLLVFRDRYSGLVVGWAISFGKPSYQTFLDGLKHMMFEKEPDPDTGVAMPYFGSPLVLGADNAKHLIGINYQEATRQLNMTTVAYRPGRGWEKGALEHLFRVLNLHVVERLPGTTRSSPEERDKMDEERRKVNPILTMPELRGFLSYYFTFIHPRQPHRGLGELCTFEGVPDELWREGMRNAPARPLIDRDIFTRLAGDVTEGTITAKGFQWDGIFYISAELMLVMENGNHKKGVRGHKGTQYKATRNPNDLGWISVRDPWGKTERWIDVPVQDAQRAYADGLRLDQHVKIRAYRKEQAKKAGKAPDLLEAKMQMAGAIIDLHKKRMKHGTAGLLARFYGELKKKFARSRRYDMRTVQYDGGRIDLAQPAVLGAPGEFGGRTGSVMPALSAEDMQAPFIDMIYPPLADDVGAFDGSYDNLMGDEDDWNA